MCQIIIQKEKETAGKISLTPGEYFIGRDWNCEIRLATANVSRRHAKLTFLNGKLLLRDLGSTNGTYVNRKRIREATISRADSITISDYTLSFEPGEHDQALRQSANRARKTVLSKPGIRRLCLALTLVIFAVCGYAFFLKNNAPAKPDSLEPIFSKIEFYRKAGNYERAILELKNALKAHPEKTQLKDMLENLQNITMVEAHIIKAASLIDEKNYQALAEQEKTLLTLQEKYPEMPEIAIWLQLTREALANRPPEPAELAPEESAALKSKSGGSAEKTAPKTKPLTKRPVENIPPEKSKTTARPKETDSPGQTPAKQKNSGLAATGSAESKTPSQTGRASGAENAPATVLPAEKSSEKIYLSDRQKDEAKDLYYQAYRIMAYKSKNAYLKALALFKKAQETAPDSDFEFYRKAGEKIEIIKEKLTEY